MSAEVTSRVAKYLETHSQNDRHSGGGVSLKKDGRGLMGVLASWGTEGEERLQRCLLYQWAEAAQIWELSLREGGLGTKQILQEIDEYLEGCSYFVGYSRSPADALMYHLLYGVLEGLTPSERRQLPCVCRWFNHIQQEETLRRDNPIINFSSSFLPPTQPQSY